MSDFFICPNCGYEVDIDAVICPECGSDDETGWSEDTDYDGLFFYDDYEPTIERENSTAWGRYLVIAVTIILILGLLLLSTRRAVFLGPVVLVIVGFAYYWRKIYPNTEYVKEKDLYENLLSKARGDGALVERWIGYEDRRNPGRERIVLMEDAIYRWERENR